MMIDGKNVPTFYYKFCTTNFALQILHCSFLNERFFATAANLASLKNSRSGWKLVTIPTRNRHDGPQEVEEAATA